MVDYDFFSQLKLSGCVYTLTTVSGLIFFKKQNLKCSQQFTGERVNCMSMNRIAKASAIPLQ